MEILFELVFEVFGQLLIEVIFGPLLELLFRGVGLGIRRLGRLLGRPWSAAPLPFDRLNSIAALVAAVVTGAGVGLGVGWWWGDRLADDALGHLPRTVWVSAVLAVVAATLLLPVVRRRVVEPATRFAVGCYLVDRRRLWFFLAFNAAFAAGTALGYA